MPESQVDEGPRAYDAPLSRTDIVKLHAATILPICAVLELAGVITQNHMSRIFALQVDPEDDAPWANIVRAISAAMATLPQTATQPEVAQPAADTPFVVIQGGRGI